MKHCICFAPLGPVVFFLAFITACTGQISDKNVAAAIPPPAGQIAEYVVEIFEDKKGNLWFGTMEKGVARYDGRSLVYFSTEDGLCGTTVTSVAEDAAGNLWFGTHSGLSRFDGITFTNFTTRNGLCDDRVSSLLIDRAGTLWVGTWNGVCRYAGAAFSDFPLPVPSIELRAYQTSSNWVSEILEDRKGNIWFCRDGYGACQYDGATFKHLTKHDGLASNNVQAIAEDRQGNIWFGSRITENDHPDPQSRTGDGGLSRYDGRTLTRFPELEGLSKNEIYAIEAGRTGNIWIGANRVGVYRYDGESFTLFRGTDRMDLTYGFGVQDILEDRNGTVWFGFSGGLFRFTGNALVNVTQAGPWK